MDHKISVTVQIDMDEQDIRIITTGCLTRLSQSALLPLIRRARKLTPGARVTLDATPARHIEALGLDLLRDAIDYEVSLSQGPPVHFVVPTHLPSHLGPAGPHLSNALTGLQVEPLKEGAS